MRSSQTKASEIFEETGLTVKVDGRFRPVLRLGKRLFAGEHLSMLNPHGFGGHVWSGKDIDELQFNINEARRRWGKSYS